MKIGVSALAARVKAEIQSLQAAARAQTSRLAVQAAALRLQAKIGWFLWYLRRYDAASLSDEQQLALQKVNEDLVAAGDSLPN